MSTPSGSAARRASASGRTLKPMIIASEAAASITSDSLMPPVWAWMTLTGTCSCGSLAISSSSASSEPETSALRTMLSSLSSPSLARWKTSSRVTLRAWRRASCSVLSRVSRSWASGAGLALVLDDLDVLAGLADPVEAEHLDRHAGGRLVSTRSPLWSSIARTLPQTGPATTASPTRSVPRWTRTPVTGPRPGSSSDSITVPDAAASGFAPSSSRSVTSRIISSRLSRPVLGLGRDVGVDGVAAPLLGVELVLGELARGRGWGRRPPCRSC